MKSLSKNKKILIAILSAVIIIMIVCVALILSGNVFIAGKLIPKSSSEIDLSGKTIDASKVLRFTSPEFINLENCEINAEDYDKIKGAFPNCEIIWSVPLSSGPVSSRITDLTLDSVSESDLSLFGYFDELKTVHAEGVSDWKTLCSLEELYPDIDFSRGVTLNEKYYSADLTKLALNEQISFSELVEKLTAFKGLKSVSLQNDGLTTDEKLSLQEAYPDISFYCTVEEFGKQFLNTVDSLDFSGNAVVDLDRLVKLAPLFKKVTSIDFTGCSYSNDEMYEVMKAFPEADVCWQLQICGKDVTSLDEEIDLSGIQITDTSEIEDSLKYFKKLNKVVMCKCGIDNEEMDALNKRHDDVRFVWTVTLGTARRGRPTYELRTDTTYFISSLQLGEENAYRLTDVTAEPLKYCTDMIALDLGHNLITKCDFCRYMPKLRFFITGGCHDFYDISPLSECKELFFLEMAFTNVRDLSPLLECKELRHLCVVACPTQDSVRSVLAQMTWLERCYMAGRTCYYSSDREYVFSDDFLPNTEKWLEGLDGFYRPWRTHPVYFEMRDALGGAYYMAKKPDGF